jgi:hypothetical protein
MKQSKKMVVPSTKPRNHVALACQHRSGAGSHRKPEKAQRRAANAKLPQWTEA